MTVDVVANRARPVTLTKTTWRDWVTTVDYKRIGILYCATALGFFVLGRLEALAIRLQLARPNGDVLDASTYNQFFTMHGLTMIFLVVMPLGVGLMNYFVPLMIGARDMALPRLNAFSYWVYLFGGLFLYTSFVVGNAPAGGWFGYAPLNRALPGDGMTYYALGLQILGVSSSVGAINLIVTILNLRAPGMTLMRMPVFAWTSLVTAFLMLFAMPVLSVALLLLTFDRLFASRFFDPTVGGDPLLWQHLFWLFGHPEVYIMIIPSFGLVSEILPVFARKPLFGYGAMVFSTIAIGFMGWGVWAHHMFTTGLGAVASAAFSLSSMMIAVPTGVKVFNWLGTLWRGSIRFATPLLFGVGFVAQFVVGGLSGVTHALAPHDAQQQDTYYVVAHFHYILFGGALFAIFGAFYYWWPKMFGWMLGERLGKLHFWLMFVGFNLTFGPFHILGLQGMPRRIYTYPSEMGWNTWNLVATVGAFVIALSVLVFAVNILASRIKRREATPDPWDARTLEWATSSPPPTHNFDRIPLVRARDDLWRAKQSPRDPLLTTSDDVAASIELPRPSRFPILAAFGLLVTAFGVLYVNGVVAGAGVLVTLGAAFAWVLEAASPTATEKICHDNAAAP
jgi:cytochrome c oxidase subunit I